MSRPGRPRRRGAVVAAWALVVTACAPAGDAPVGVEERRLIELMEMRRAGDATGIEALFHPTAVYEDFSSGTRYIALPEIADFVESFHRTRGATFLEVVAYHPGAGMAVAEWVLEGTRTGTEEDTESPVLRRFRVDGLTLVEVEDGLIVRAADYADPTALLLAEGARVILPDGDTLRAMSEPVTGPPPRP